MKRNYILTVLLLITGSAFSQGITNRDITWYSTQAVELHSNVDINKASKIITHGTSHIDLIVDADVLSFTIVRVDGTWTSPNQEGALVYHVKYQDRPGKITIERTTGITITIDFTGAAPDAMKEKFFITSFE